MLYILNSYHLNLFLLILIVMAIKVAYHSRCDYSDLVTKINQLSLTEIGTT